MTNPSPSILGVKVNALTMNQAIELIIQQAGTKTGSAQYVVKPYVEFFDRAYRDPEIGALLNHAWLRLPDGVSAQWAAAYLSGPPKLSRALKLAINIITNSQAVKSPLPEKFGGTVFTWRLLEACASRHLTVYLIGSPKSGTIKQTAQSIRERLPQLSIVGTWPGQWGGMEGEHLRARLQTAPLEAKLLADLHKQRPHIVLVGMGFPLQEELMAKLVPQLSQGVLIGEGGTFDYDSFGGKRAKAPAWIQRSGLEWLWRLLMEPSRWQRQLAVPRFMWTVYRSSKMKPKTSSTLQ